MLIELEEPFKSRWRKGYLQTHADGRRYVCLFNSNEDRTIVSYARYLVSVRIGGDIPAGYEVDHRDDDRTNDSPDNLQIVTEEFNRLKQHYNYVMNQQIHYGYVCAYCENPFLLTERQVKMRLKQSQSGLAFCSHPCSVAYHGHFD